MGKSFTTFCWVSLLVFAFATSPTAFAQAVLHDTTGNAFDTNWLVGLNGPPGSTINQPADSFVVSGGAFFLDSLTLDLSASLISVVGVADDYEIRFWDNDVDKPGTLLESFTVVGSTSLSGPTTVSSVDRPLLSSGSTYWVSAALPDDLSRGTWTGVEGTSNGRAIAFSGAESATWIATTPPHRSLYLRVTGTAIPEPSTLGLLVGCVCLTSMRRPSRRHRHSS